MAIAVVSSVLLPRGVTGATSGSIDTTGASLLVMGLAGFQPVNAYTISDSKSNTWTPLTLKATGAANEARTQLFYVANPTVGTGHTFTWAYAGYGNATAAVIAFSGAATASPFDLENGFAINSEVSTIQPGSITPSENNEVVVVMGGFPNDMTSGTGAIDGGFTIAHQQNFGGSNVVGGLMAYLIQTTAAAANPTITAPTGTDPMSAVIASFKSAGGGGGSLSVNPAGRGGLAGPGGLAGVGGGLVAAPVANRIWVPVSRRLLTPKRPRLLTPNLRRAA